MYTMTYPDAIAPGISDPWGIRRAANFVGVGMILTMAAAWILVPLIQVILSLTYVIQPGLPKGGLGDVEYVIYYIGIYLCYMALPLPLTVLLMRRRIRPFAATQKTNAGAGDVTAGVLLGLGLCILANLVAAYFVSFLTQFGIPMPDVDNDLLFDSPLGLALYFLVIAVLPAIFEEMVFRGYVLKALLPYGKGLAVTVSALLFGLLHGNLLQVPFALIVGLCCGWLTVQTGSIWAAVLLHLTNNGLSVLLEYVSLRLLPEQQNSLIFAVYALVATVGLSGVVALIATRSSLLRPIGNGGGALSVGYRLRRILTTPTLLITLILMLGMMLLLVLVPEGAAEEAPQQSTRAVLLWAGHV